MTHKEGIVGGLEHLHQTKLELEDLKQQTIDDDNTELHDKLKEIN